MPRIKEACDAAGVRVEYTNHRQGVIVSFYRPEWSLSGPLDDRKESADEAHGDLINELINDLINFDENERLVL